jgi:hypothetical protein
MAFDFFCVSQRILSRERASGRSVGESYSGHGGSSAASKATGHWNFVFHSKPHGGQLKPFFFGGITHRAEDQILFGRPRQRSAADASGASERTRAWTNLHGGAGGEIHFESKAETIEAGAEIRRRRGNANFDRTLARRGHCGDVIKV